MLFSRINRSPRSLPARKSAPPPNFLHPPGLSVGAFEFGVNGTDPRQHLRVSQALAVRCTASLPGLIATRTHRLRGRLPLCVNPGVLHSTSFAKHTVAFFGISHSIRSRASSACKRDSSICSGSRFVMLSTYSWMTKFRGNPSRYKSICSSSTFG